MQEMETFYLLFPTVSCPCIPLSWNFRGHDSKASSGAASGSKSVCT